MERCISPNEKEMKRCISSLQSVMINISPEMYGSFQNSLSTIFFSSHELTVSFTMHTFLISNFISLQLELGHPVQNHRPDIDQPMPESDSEISDGDQISSDSDSLDSEVNFSSEEDVEVFPLPSDDEDEVQPVPLDNSSLEVEDRHNQSTYANTIYIKHIHACTNARTHAHKCHL